MMRTPAALLAICVLAPLLQGQSGKILDKTYSVSSRPDLQLVVDDSSVRAQSCGGCREVRIHVDTRDMNLSDFRLVESQSGNGIRFSLKRPEGLHWNMGVRRQPEITVMLPADSNASLHSSDGSIGIAGVNGEVDLRSGDGSISAADVRGALRVNTGDGSVTVQRAEGTLSATTGDGSIRADGRFAQVDARTGDGGVQITAQDGSTLSNGVHITSGDGSVTLRVPRNIRAEVDLRSGDGSIRCDLPLVVQSSSNDRHAVRGSLNGGGSTIRVNTGDGSVSVSGL